jgi:hypothetical protein
MSAPSDGGLDSELSKYAPKWAKERLDAERPPRTVSTVPSLKEEYPDRR